MAEIILNKHGQKCGGAGKASEVYTLGSFYKGHDYYIEISSIDPSFAETMNIQDEEGREAGSIINQDTVGTIRLPVRSVGRQAGRFYYATDLRFVVYPGMDCVFPRENRLGLYVEQVGGGWRGSLILPGLDGYTVTSCTTRPTEEEVVAFLAAWCSRQEVGRFHYPDRIVAFMREAMETEIEALDQDADELAGDSIMDDAFG